MITNANNKGNSYDVKHRLLTVAEELFAEKGFNRTSVRDITRKADCNVASINYYFGGKDKLHLEVYKQNFSTLRDVRIKAITEILQAKEEDISMDELVRAFVIAFFAPFSNDEAGHKRLMLLWREMIEPHLPDRMIFEEVIAPVSEVFGNAFNNICPDVEREHVYLCMQSIVGQLAHMTMALHIYPGRNADYYKNLDLDEYINHVVMFSTAGIMEVAKKYSKKRD